MVLKNLHLLINRFIRNSIDTSKIIRDVIVTLHQNIIQKVLKNN